MQELLYGVSMARDVGYRRGGARACRRSRRYWPSAAVDDLVGAANFPDGRDGEPRRRGARAREGRGGRGAALRSSRARRDGVHAATAGRGGGLGHRRGAIDRRDQWCSPTGLWTSELARLAGASVSLYPAEHVWVMTEEAEGARENAADPARPGRLPLHAALPGAVPGRRVRAEGEAAGRRGRSTTAASWSSGRTGTTSRRCWRRRASGCRSSRRSGSSTTCARPRASRPTRTSTWASSPRCAGCSSRRGSTRRGSSTGPAPGKALAEWIVEGHPTMDLAEVDIARAGRWAERPRVAARARRRCSGGCTRCTGRAAAATARGVRRTPLADRLGAAGAAFGEAAGWERPNWFEPGVTDARAAATRSTGRRGSSRSREEVPGRARGRGAVRPVVLLEVPGAGRRAPSAGCSGCARATSTCPRTRRVHDDVQRARGHRDGSDRHAPRRGPVPGGGADARTAAHGGAAARRAPRAAPRSPT